MAVLFFSKGKRSAENSIKRITGELGQTVEIYRSLSSLSKRFHKPRQRLCVMIFLAPDRNTLLELLSIHDHMYDLPIMLILPDSKRQTVLNGHKLYPRFITFIDGDYSDLAQSLSNIISHDKRIVYLDEAETGPNGQS